MGESRSERVVGSRVGGRAGGEVLIYMSDPDLRGFSWESRPGVMFGLYSLRDAGGGMGLFLLVAGYTMLEKGGGCIRLRWVALGQEDGGRLGGVVLGSSYGMGWE